MNSDWLEIHALVDDELSTEGRAKLQEKLKSCDKTQAEFRAVREIKTLLQEKCTPTQCEEAWRACCKRLDAIDRTKRAEGFVGRYAWGICSVFICLILGAAWFNHMNGAGLNAGDVAKAASTLAPISAPRSQNSDAKLHWLQDNLDKNFDKLAPQRADTISVVGGASGFLQDGRKIAKADLQDRQGLLTLYVVQEATQLDDVAPVDGHSHYSGTRINDSNCITWTDHGCAYVLIADRPIDALCQAADQLCAAR